MHHFIYFLTSILMNSFFFQIVLVLIFIVAVIMYRVLIAIPLFQNEVTRSQASTIASMSSAIVNLILIMALGKVYEKLALKLTQWGRLCCVFISGLEPRSSLSLSLSLSISHLLHLNELGHEVTAPSPQCRVPMFI